MTAEQARCLGPAGGDTIMRLRRAALLREPLHFVSSANRDVEKGMSRVNEEADGFGCAHAGSLSPRCSLFRRVTIHSLPDTHGGCRSNANWRKAKRHHDLVGPRRLVHNRPDLLAQTHSSRQVTMHALTATLRRLRGIAPFPPLLFVKLCLSRPRSPTSDTVGCCQRPRCEE